MTPQGQAAPPASQSWFANNWKWLLALGCLLPTVCCGGFTVIAAVLPSGDAAARVDCGTPGPAGVDCDLTRTAGEGALEACWDLEISCANGGLMVGHGCGAIAAGASASKLNMPVSGFSNQDACDAPKSGVVTNLIVRALE